MKSQITNFYGGFLILLGAFMLLPLFIALIYGETGAARAFFIVLLPCFAIGGMIRISYRSSLDNMKLKLRESYAIVTTTWLIASAIGCLPYILTGTIPDFFDAFFETCSGFTTTGATILNDVEAVPRSLLFWRSFTQWLGGMGIIVLFVALLPRFGIKARNIAKAETPGPTVTKMTSRFTTTAQQLYIVYILLTILLTLLLLAGGLDLFESVNHAFTTMATGGFSVYNDSIGHFHNNYISWVITLFMFIAGTNFELFFIAFHGEIRRALRNDEFRFYCKIVGLSTLAIMADLLLRGGYDNAFKALTDSAFQVTTIISTTGFATTNFDLWPSFCQMVLVLLMIAGACSSSTAGGIKCVRILVLWRMIKREVKAKIHETIVNDIALDGRKMLPETILYIISFITMYFIVTVVGTFAVSLTGDGNLTTNLTAVISCISNVGPGLDNVGPVCTYDFYNGFAKFILSLIMIAGRLELSTFMILFSRFFWNPYAVN